QPQAQPQAQPQPDAQQRAAAAYEAERQKLIRLQQLQQRNYEAVASANELQQIDQWRRSIRTPEGYAQLQRENPVVAQEINAWDQEAAQRATQLSNHLSNMQRQDNAQQVAERDQRKREFARAADAHDQEFAKRHPDFNEGMRRETRPMLEAHG